MRTRVKICGFTRPEDALFAARAGVDAIGLVFYPPSPRNISIKTARDIVSRLPAFVTVVALFVDADEAFIRDVLAQVPVDCLQFHGDETPEQCRKYAKPYIKAIRMREDLHLADIEKQFSDASALLLDTYHPGIQGGSGEAFNWEWIPERCSLPVILAGGLTVENAAQAVKTVRPYALDVSSGVEQAKGIKDPAKMAAFINHTNQVKEETL